MAKSWFWKAAAPRGRQRSLHRMDGTEGLVRGVEVIDTGKAIAMPVGEASTAACST
jgi:F0F1-type ATP synthase beta subunit